MAGARPPGPYPGLPLSYGLVQWADLDQRGGLAGPGCRDPLALVSFVLLCLPAGRKPGGELATIDSAERYSVVRFSATQSQATQSLPLPSFSQGPTTSWGP